ncbi:hypothetical protein CRN49_02270, partial [Vibrio vulnificus]
YPETLPILYLHIQRRDSYPLYADHATFFLVVQDHDKNLDILFLSLHLAIQHHQMIVALF